MNGNRKQKWRLPFQTAKQMQGSKDGVQGGSKFFIRSLGRLWLPSLEMRTTEGGGDGQEMGADSVGSWKLKVPIVRQSGDGR